MIRSILSNFLNIKGDFQYLFFYNEFKELVGKSRGGLIGLSAILTLTFIALGFSIGTLKELGKKMDNPFTNWVNLPITFDKQDEILKILEDFQATELKKDYGLHNIGQYRIDFPRFPHNITGNTFTKTARVIDPGEKLFIEILSGESKNVLAGFKFDSKINDHSFEDDCSLIIKEEALIKLGYDDYTKVKSIPLIYEDLTEKIRLYIPVKSVVKSLPNNADILFTTKFNLLINNKNYDLFRKKTSNQLQFLTPEMDFESLKTILRKSVSDDLLVDIKPPEIRSFIEGENHQLITLYFSDFMEYETIDSIFHVLLDNLPDAQKQLPWDCVEVYQSMSPHYLSFNFNKLDKIRGFKDFLKNTYEVDISMSQVEAKDNFSLVSNLTNFLSLILLAFSLLSIIFYINSMLKTHLEKIKMNLGTLKAFGLNSQFLMNSYIKIIVTFLVLSILIAFSACLLYLIVSSFLFDAGENFDILDFKILAAIAIIIIVAVITTRKTISKTLLKTPGDLIYNR